MPYHAQETPPSSHLPSMADCRLPPISIPPPGPYSHTAADYRVLPLPLNLPPISQLNPPPVIYPSTNFHRRYLTLSNPAVQIGSNVQARPLHPYDAASFQGAGSTSNASSSAPAVTIGGSHAASIPGGDRKVGKSDFNQLWIERHLTDLEVFSRSESGEERGRVYLGLWLAIREVGLRDKQGVRLFIAKNIVAYDWFKGDETIGEVLRALHRLEFINFGLLAKKHSENAKWFWDKKIGNISVRDYWLEEARKLRHKVQTQPAHAQAQTQAQAQAQR